MAVVGVGVGVTWFRFRCLVFRLVVGCWLLVVGCPVVVLSC